MSQSSFSIDGQKLTASAMKETGNKQSVTATVNVIPYSPTGEQTSNAYGEFRYTLYSDEPMELVDWGVPRLGLNDPILNEDVSNPYEIWVEVSLYDFWSDLHYMTPTVIINGQLVQCPRQEFGGVAEPFLFYMSRYYDSMAGQHNIQLVNERRTSNSQVNVETYIDGVLEPGLSYVWPNGQGSKPHLFYDDDYQPGYHHVQFKVMSLGEEKNFEFYLFGKATANMTLTETFNDYGATQQISVNTNRKGTCNLEIYVDGVLEQTILAAAIASWPYNCQINKIAYDPGTYNWWVIVRDTNTTDFMESTHHSFTGTAPVKVAIAYGANVTAVADQTSLIRPPYKAIIYKFNGTAGDQIRIAVNAWSGATDSFVALYSPTMQLLISDDESGGAGNALIASFTLPTTGEYTIDSCWWAYSGNNGYLQTILTKLN